MLIISDIVIYHFWGINYLVNILKIIFLSQTSPEWVSGLGTLIVTILALRKTLMKSKPGLLTHIDKNNVCIEIIGNSDVSRFAIIKHIYIVNKDLSKQFPMDFISAYKNSKYSEPFSNSKKAVIYLKKGKNDDRLKPIINLAKSFENQSKSHIKDCHYIDVYFSINDHILPISLRHLINVDDLMNEHWPNKSNS